MIRKNRKFWANKKVLVTGHEGFLGSWLAKALAENGARVVGIDKVSGRKMSVLKGVRKDIKCIKGNIANLKLVEKTINSFKPSIIFHLAAQAIVGRANKDPVENFKSNIQGTWNILEAARSKPFIDAIVVASSDKAYGSHKKLPYKENTPLQGDHPYDASKSCADLICKTYFHTYDVPVSVTRCGNIYGPGDLNFSRLIPDAIRHIIKNKQFVIRSNGKFTRDYIFVVDIVNAYLLLAEKLKRLNLGGEAFNVSNEKPISVLNLFNKIVDSYGKQKINPKILNKAEYEIQHQYLTSKKAKSVLGWKAQYTLEKGLTQTIKWYKEQLMTK